MDARLRFTVRNTDCARLGDLINRFRTHTLKLDIVRIMTQSIALLILTVVPCADKSIMGFPATPKATSAAFLPLVPSPHP